MRVLDIDMDYFMNYVAYGQSEDNDERLPEEGWGEEVWSVQKVRSFFEKNLGLSKNRKIRGRIVVGHNEALSYWRELIFDNRLSVPFEVIHIDSHADLGLGYLSHTYISSTLLGYPVKERPFYNQYTNEFGDVCEEKIGDYLLFAIAYRWISKLTYCANPQGEKNDYIMSTLKDFKENHAEGRPTFNTIQLLYNPGLEKPCRSDSNDTKVNYILSSCKEPEVPFLIIPTIEDVKYDGDFDYIVMAQSPNYTPASADFIMDILREYIIEE